MERLTYDFCIAGKHCWQVKGADNLECSEVCKSRDDEGCNGCPIANAFDRLAAIEDILGDDYDLDRLKELVQADKEGKCVLLPCKHNDTVWFIKSAFSVACFPIEANYVSIRGIDCDGDVLYAAITAYNKIERRFKKSDIGKTVFLNLKEAEAALEKMKEDK